MVSCLWGQLELTGQEEAATEKGELPGCRFRANVQHSEYSAKPLRATTDMGRNMGRRRLPEDLRAEGFVVLGARQVVRLKFSRLPLTHSLGSSKFVKGRPCPGMEFMLAGMECEIDRRSSKEE